MNSFNFGRFIILTFLLASLSVAVFAQKTPDPQQAPAVSAPARGVVVEVTYYTGRAFAYQRVGEWSWYAMFRRPADWKPRSGELPVAAVKITPRHEDGQVKARVTVLRGRNHEVEDFVADYVLTAEKKTAVRELSDLGVEPFELQLVRAPATVADLPAVVNHTKSLEVTVEPTQSSLPTFSARVLNNSPKPVATFFCHTSIDGVRKSSGAPRSEAGGPLIKPGEVFQKSFKYPIKPSTVSTGEVPGPQGNLVFTVTAVVFTDGTYEGDEFEAANYLAGNAGQKAQLRRFLDLIRSKEFTNSEPEIEAAILSVNVDAVTAEIAQKFPALTAEQKAQLRGVVDFGKSVGVKLFRSARAESLGALAERLQKQIDALP